MKSCKIHLKEGTKEADVELSYEAGNEIVILDGMFQFFGVKVDYEDVAKKRISVMKMYAEFYSDDKNFKCENGSVEHAETGEEFFTNLQKELNKMSIKSESTARIELNDEENPGLRIRNGIKQYRCNYKCPRCRNLGNHYVPRNAKTISCHKCEEKMIVHQVNKDFSHDAKFNYFVAGLRRNDLTS